MKRRVILNAHFPGEPIAYKRVEGHGSRRYVPKIMRQAQQRLQKALARIAPDLKPSSMRFGVQQVFHIGSLCSKFHEPDGDNLEKLLWDAFNGRVWIDDAQIEEWQGRKVLNAEKPHTHLIIYTLEP